jgi:hypoxanthine phosphoribosyltransferase
MLFSPEQIAARVREMGLDVARRLGDTRPLFVGVLKGACMFQCDLARATPIDLDLDFLSVSSYGAGTTTTGTVRILADLREDITGRDIVLCEGVVDSGISLTAIRNLLDSRGAKSIQVAALLDKVPCRKVQVPIDFTGWRIGTEFVVGYGMDAAERYRNLPYVGILEETSAIE